MKKILFTGGGGAGNEALFRFLKDRYDLYFADANPDTINSLIPSYRRFVIPMANDEGFIDGIVSVTESLKIDIIVPGVDEELFKLASAERELKANIFLPSIGFIKLMLDKLACANAIIGAGLTAPKTECVTSACSIGFPLIVKPKYGRGSRGVMVVKSQQELDAYRILYNTIDNDLIVQGLAIGQEYTILVSANICGQLNCVVPLKVQQKKGITISAVIDMNAIIINYVKSFHRMFRTKGVYNIQCILTRKGVVLPFEVNPRISTTFCVSVAAGLDPFELYDKNNHEENLLLPSGYLRLTRTWINNITGFEVQ